MTVPKENLPAPIHFMRLAVCLIVLISSGTAQGLREDSLFSTSLHAHMKYCILLPTSFATTKYPVLYLLHGLWGNNRNWVANTALQRYAEGCGFIIVMPDAKDSWYTNSPVVPSERYEDAIIQDLIPHIEKKYPVLASRKGRAIAGLSMGGYGAVKFAIKYPQMFMVAGSFSGTLDVPFGQRTPHLTPSLDSAFGDTAFWRENHLPSMMDSTDSAVLPYLYISVGEQDYLDRIVEANRTFCEMLRSRKAAYEYHELPGGHSWMFWYKEISHFLGVIKTLNSSKR